MLPVVAKSPTLSLYGLGLKYDVTAKTVTLLNQTTETLRADYLNEVYFNRCLGLSCGLDVVSLNNG